MGLKTTDNPIDSAGPVRQVVSNLFYGWGYNFYRKENQLRADDLLIRSKVSEMLASARGHLAVLERTYRRDHMPPRTRQNPFPDAACMAIAQGLQRVQYAIEALEVRVRTAAVPAMDRVTQRHINERENLERLAALDEDMVRSAQGFVDGVIALEDPAAAGRTAAALLEHLPLDALLKRRVEVVSIIEA